MLLKVLVFVLGLIIGSFLNVCIYRIPNKKSITNPPSFCPKCLHELSLTDMIPLAGYLINKGRCRYCKQPISLQYPLVELITAAVMLVLFIYFDLGISFVKYLVLSCLLIVATFVDLEKQEIPDELIVIGLVTGLIFNIYDIKTTMLSGIIGFVLGGGIFLVIAMLTNGAMGGGDIKLMGVVGLYLGWRYILLISMLSFVIGGVVSLILIAARIKNRKDYIPFGPFIAIAAMIVFCYGEWFLRMFIEGMHI